VSRDIDIVLAGPADLAAIADIANWAAAHTPANFATEPEPESLWRQWWSDTHRAYPWLVARGDGRVLGFAKASPHRARGAYAWSAEVTVYVHPERHGQRIGTRLYERLIPLLRAQGYVTLYAGITTPNPGSVRLHEAFGFVRCGNLPRAGWKFGRWHDVGYWHLALASGDGAPGPIAPVADVWR
jgi:L-amino acid N-acyltransferase YncA